MSWVPGIAIIAIRSGFLRPHDQVIFNIGLGNWEMQPPANQLADSGTKLGLPNTRFTALGTASYKVPTGVIDNGRYEATPTSNGPYSAFA